MSLNPKIKRIILPPASVVSKSASLITQLDALRQPSDTSASPGNSTPSSNNNPASPPVPIPRLLTQHPVLPWIAYILEDKLIIVQHTVTKAILYHTHIQDVAAAVYGETEPKKLPAAAKSLGRVRHLSFYDCSTIYWSGLHTVTTDPPYPVYPSLAVQTDRRVLVLNLRQGASHISPVVSVQCSPPRSYYRRVTAHVCEKTVSSVPSSTVLPLTDRWLLVGCADGSMKCYDWTAAMTVKKIKGLGKGDCVVQLLAANPYHQQQRDPSKPRILTVTKRGTVFLIALDLQHDTLEIQPPMARFTVPDGATTANTSTSGVLEHTTFSYNAHTDTFQWYCTAEKQEPVLYLWDLKDLTANKSGSMAKPEPSLVIHYPAVSMAVAPTPGLPGLGSLLPNDHHHHTTPEPGASNKPTLSSVVRTDTAILGGLVHPAFDTETFVSVSVTARGDLCVHGVSKSSITTSATPVVMIPLAEWIVQAMGKDDTEFPATELQVYSMTHAPLSGAGCHVVVATNWGIIVVELGIATVSPERRTCVGARHWHLGAGLGSLGKAVVGGGGGGALVYGSLDVSRTTCPGWLAVKNPTTLYTSSVSQHMPPEFTKRPFRMAAQFLTSPTGVYVAVFWPAEFRYEILHTATALQGVGNTNRNTTTSPVVASGTGVADICWVTDADIFCILHAPEKQEAAAQEVPKQLEESPGNFILSPLGVVATTVTKTAIAVPLSATKLATTAAVTTTTAAVNTTMTAANMTVGATTKAVRATTKGVTQIGAKALGIFGKKKRGGDGSIMTAEEDEEEVTMTAADLDVLQTPTNAGISNFQQQPKKEQERFVEFRQLEEIASSKTVEGGIPAATCATLGKLTLRGGNRVLPAAIFGGPVLCVATKTEDGNDGQAQFYSHKSFDNLRAESFVSAGPSLPYPETVVWDDDGRLCAMIVENRVAVYLSSPPEFVLLGTVHIGSPSVPSTSITSVKFVHGALYCCTWNTVHCVLLGDLTGGICHLDAYLLACTEVAMIPEAPLEETVSPFAPIPQPLPLVRPTVLGYQGGSLVVSSLCGVHAVSLNCPLLRIGIFLAAGQVEKAVKWFDAVPDSHHETLATFLERRGHPELILQLPGLCLETMVDVCMRFTYVDRLEEIVETYGIHGLHEIDMGQGVVRTVFGPEPDTAPSIVVSVGAYLMAHGRVELARRMAAECLRSKHGNKDAFMLATLLMPVDQADASRLVQRAVTGDDVNEDWAVGNYVRNYLLNERT